MYYNSQIHIMITFLVSLIVVVDDGIVGESVAAVVVSKELIIEIGTDSIVFVKLLAELLNELLVASISFSNDEVSSLESDSAVDLSDDVTVGVSGDIMAVVDSTSDGMTVVDGVVNDFAGDVTSDVDSVAISVVSSVVTSGEFFVVTDTVDDITFIVEGFVVINLADVSDGSESVMTVIGNVSTLSE